MKKYLLALAVVVAMAGVAVADVHDPHNPQDPTKPHVKPVVSADIIVVPTPTVTGVPGKVDVVVPGKEDSVKKINDLISNGSFKPVSIHVDGKSLDKVVEPVVTFAISADSASWDSTSPDKMVIVVSVDATKANSAFMRASKNGTISVDKSYAIKSGDWYGTPVVSTKAISDNKGIEITVNKPWHFFTSSDIVLAKSSPVATGGSSSGCNVGFAPMALLLGLPLFFLKK